MFKKKKTISWPFIDNDGVFCVCLCLHCNSRITIIKINISCAIVSLYFRMCKKKKKTISIHYTVLCPRIKSISRARIFEKKSTGYSVFVVFYYYYFQCDIDLFLLLSDALYSAQQHCTTVPWKCLYYNDNTIRPPPPMHNNIIIPSVLGLYYNIIYGNADGDTLSTRRTILLSVVLFSSSIEILQLWSFFFFCVWNNDV